jgi:hypothetical protein
MFSREYPKGGGTVIGLDLDWGFKNWVIKNVKQKKISSEMNGYKGQKRPTTYTNSHLRILMFNKYFPFDLRQAKSAKRCGTYFSKPSCDGKYLTLGLTSILENTRSRWFFV